MNRWVEEQAEGFRELSGCAASGWVGQEMALREEGPSGSPLFHDPEVPLLQVYLLHAATDRAGYLISTYQNDHTWGLCIQRDDGDHPTDPGSIFRTRRLVEMPLGRIEGVCLAFGDEGDIVEVGFTIGGKGVTMWAGEVYEEWAAPSRSCGPTRASSLP